MRILIVTSVQAERDAIGETEGVTIVVGGVGRTNAAAATTETVIRHGPFDLVINAGIAGALPGSDLAIGDAVLASKCVYFEEGLNGPDGFADMAAMGFPLGDFDGNVVPVNESLLRRVSSAMPPTPRTLIGPIATVATCSGTNEAAAAVVGRTGAIAEAMEGAAVVHAARRLKLPALEIRSISNFTGDRAGQRWDLKSALRSLAAVMRSVSGALQARTA